MNYWSWDPSLSIGIDTIDEQHKRILDYINELGEARTEKNKEKVTQVLEGLVDYTATHFQFEEDLMEKSGYYLSDAHKRVHRSFIAIINRYIERHHAGEDITRKLMSDLQVWLVSHIKKDDLDYAPLVKKHLKRNRPWIQRSLKRLFGKYKD